MEGFLIRRAVVSEQKTLEELQMRASLTNAGDRAALLAHPDAIELPAEQIAAGSVFVAERSGVIAGFAAVLPRADGDTELDALFVEPTMRRCGVGRSLVEYCSEAARLQASAFLPWSAILTPRISILHAVFDRPERLRRASGLAY